MQRKALYRRYLIIYVSFFFVLSLTIVPLFNISYHTLEEQSVTAAQDILQNGLLQIEDELDNIYTVGMSLYESSQYGTLLSIPSASVSPPALTVNSLRTFLSVFSDMSNMLTLSADFGFILPNQLAFDAQRAYMPAQNFYGAYFKVEGFDSLDQWRRIIVEKDYPCILSANVSLYSIVSNTNSNMMSPIPAILVSLPLPLKGTARTFCYAVIPETTLIDTLVFSNEMLESSALILKDRSGTVLLQNDRVLKGNTISITAHSSKYSLIAEMTIQKSYFVKQLSSFTSIFSVFLALYLTLGVVLVLIYSRQNAKPMQKMVTLAQQVEQQQALRKNEIHDAYQYMNRFIDQVDSRLKENSLALARQEVLIRENLTERLLRQRIYSPSTLDLLGTYFPDFPSPCVMVLFNLKIAVTLYQLPPNTFSEIQMTVREAAEKHLGSGAIYHFTTGSLVVILSPRPNIRDCCIAIAQELSSSPDTAVRISISMPYENIEDTNAVFSSLTRLLRFPRTDTDVIEEKPFDSTPALQIHSANKFYEMLSRRRIQSALDILDKDLAAASENPDEISIQQMFFCYRSVLCQLISYGQLDVSAVHLPDYNPGLSIGELFSGVREAAQEIVRLLKEKEEHSPQEEKILQCIEDNIGSPMFDIECIVKAFSMSDKAVQRLMRGATGMTFFEYLYHRRMEKAKVLLEETDLPIQEISNQCGYASLNTFYKAFQRTYAATPSSMRNPEETPGSEADLYNDAETAP